MKDVRCEVESSPQVTRSSVVKTAELLLRRAKSESWRLILDPVPSRCKVEGSREATRSSVIKSAKLLSSRAKAESK